MRPRYIIILGAFWSLSPGDVVAVSSELRPPPEEIAAMTTRLEELAAKARGAKQVANDKTIGAQLESARRAFDAGASYFTKKQSLSAVRELNAFVALSQTPDMARLLPALRMLGASYESLGLPTQAQRMYMRYLSNFIAASESNAAVTPDDAKELANVVRRVSHLAGRVSQTADPNPGQILASLASLRLPAETRALATYAAAGLATSIGRQDLAREWYGQTASLSSGDKADPVLRSRSVYQEALILIAERRFDEAETLLNQLRTAEAQKGSAEEVNLANLALARVEVHRRSPDRARDYYALVNSDSPLYREALFESMYVNVELGAHATAQKQAREFLDKFADGEDTYQVKVLAAYLDLLAGDLKTAASSIETSNKQLTDLRTFLRTNLSGRRSISQSDLAAILERTRMLTATSPQVREANRLFASIAEATRQIHDIENEIQTTIFVMGRASLEQLRPFWTARSQQLSEIGEQALEAGHRLAAIERHHYAEKIDPALKQRLAASEARRTRLFSPIERLRRQGAGWANWGNLAALNADLATSEQRLQAAQADLSAAQLLAQGKDADASQQQALQKLRDTADTLRQTIDKSARIVRGKRTLALADQGPHRDALVLLTKYASALDDERAALDAFRDEETSGINGLLAADAETAWNKWRTVTREVHDQLQLLDQDIRRELKANLDALDNYSAQAAALLDESETIRERLEKTLGNDMSQLLSYYEKEIASRQARHQKWSADIQWLNFSATRKNRDALDRKRALEQQILRDNLQDLGSGVRW